MQSHLREAEEVLRETTEEMSSLRHPKQSDEPEDNDESDEMMLRAQLLASLAERRRKRIDEEVSDSILSDWYSCINALIIN